MGEIFWHHLCFRRRLSFCLSPWGIFGRVNERRSFSLYRHRRGAADRPAGLPDCPNLQASQGAAQLPLCPSFPLLLRKPPARPM